MSFGVGRTHVWQERDEWRLTYGLYPRKISCLRRAWLEQGARVRMPLSDVVLALTSRPTLYDLIDGSSRDVLLESARKRSIRRGEFLFSQDDPTVNAFLIDEGYFLLFRTNKAGKEIAYDWLASGDACGLEDVLSCETYTFSCQATSSGSVWRISRISLLSSLATRKSVAAPIIKYLGYCLRRQAEHTALISLENLAVRIRGVLSYLSPRGTLYGEKILLPIIQSDLATMAHASRQRTNAILARLEEMGVVKCSRKGIYVLDKSRL